MLTLSEIRREIRALQRKYNRELAIYRMRRVTEEAHPLDPHPLPTRKTLPYHNPCKTFSPHFLLEKPRGGHPWPRKAGPR